MDNTCWKVIITFELTIPIIAWKTSKIAAVWKSWGVTKKAHKKRTFNQEIRSEVSAFSANNFPTPKGIHEGTRSTLSAEAVQEMRETVKNRT